MVFMLVRKDHCVDRRHRGNVELARRPDHAGAAAMSERLDQQRVDKNSRAGGRKHPALMTEECGLKHGATPAAGPPGEGPVQRVTGGLSMPLPCGRAINFP